MNSRPLDSRQSIPPLELSSGGMHHTYASSNVVVSVDVDINATHVEGAEWMSEIFNLKETTRLFEDSLQSLNVVDVH